MITEILWLVGFPTERKVLMMNKITFLFLTLGILLIVDPLHVGEWNEKPVMCEQKKSLKKLW